MGPPSGPFLYMDQRKKKPKRKWLSRILIAVGVIVLATLLGTGAFVGYIVFTTDAQADMKLMQTMRGSRTTRLYISDGSVPQDSLTLENYMPVESDILFGDENMVWAESVEIPEELKAAFISIEDSGFYHHHGVEWGRTIYAALNQIFRFRPRFGGSTITQQLIKNVHGEKDISVTRKAREIVRARRVEKEYSKDEILTYYLNIVPLGNNCVGVKSASHYYFNKDLSDLTHEECAALAAITNAPAKYEPQKHPENNQMRRQLVLSAMKREGYLSEEAYRKASDAELVLDITNPIYTSHSHNWYTDTVVGDVVKALMAEYDMSEGAANAMIYRGGLEIYTFMDENIQNSMEAYFADEGKFKDEEGHVFQAGMTVLDPVSGNLLGVVGGVGEKSGSRLYNRATTGYYPPGSALKPPALYGPGIEWDVIHYATAFEDIPMGEAGNYWPHNSPNLYAGRINAHTALAKSKNTVAVQLLHMLGQSKVYNHLKNTLGMTGLVKGQNASDDAVAPLALGQMSYGTTVRELTNIYASFASGGTLSKSRSYLAVFDANGKLLLKNDNAKKRVWSEETAFLLTKMMEEVVDSGTARRITLKELVDTVGKTGTSGADRDKWFVGYTPYYVAGIHCAHDDRTPLTATSRAHLTAWDNIMREIHELRFASLDTIRGFEMPEGIVQAEYCLDSGMMPTDACRIELRGDRTEVGYFKADMIPDKKCHMHVEGHYSFLEDAYGYGFANREDCIDFYVLSVPDRKQFEDATIQDETFTLEYWIKEKEREIKDEEEYLTPT